MAGVDSVVSLAYKLTGPIRKKAMDVLGINTKGKPGRSGDGIVVGRDRVRIEKKLNQLKGGGKALGAAAIIHELLGINTVADGSIKKDGANYTFVPVKPKANRANSQGGRTAAQAKAASKKPAPKKKLPMPKTLPKSKPKKKAKNTSMFDTTGTLPGKTITDKRKKGK